MTTTATAGRNHTRWIGLARGLFGVYLFGSSSWSVRLAIDAPPGIPDPLAGAGLRAMLDILAVSFAIGGLCCLRGMFVDSVKGRGWIAIASALTLLAFSAWAVGLARVGGEPLFWKAEILFAVPQLIGAFGLIWSWRAKGAWWSVW